MKVIDQLHTHDDLATFLLEAKRVADGHDGALDVVSHGPEVERLHSEALRADPQAEISPDLRARVVAACVFLYPPERPRTDVLLSQLEVGTVYLLASEVSIDFGQGACVVLRRGETLTVLEDGGAKFLQVQSSHGSLLKIPAAASDQTISVEGSATTAT